MHLYNLTLQGQTAINQAVHGNFSGTPKAQEICVGRGSTLQLLFCDPTTGKIKVLCSHEVFGIVRSLMPFRLTGGTKDYIAIGSDSGRIVILEYSTEKNSFVRVHQETFGKTGCRRIVPGHYLAVDPKGRAIMIGAVERQKLVYIMNRDAEARLTISSPLEAHKQYTLCYGMVGIDVGFENPTFACLEYDYEDAEHDPTGEALQTTKQTLTFYELDLGLNHVVRKYAEPLDDKATMIIAVPGGNEGPSGVILCCENYLIYKNLGEQPDIRCPIPRRRNDLDDPDRSLMIICAATHKTKLMYFFLLQTEQGDLFKVTLETDEDLVTEMKVKYFDTVPAANAMCILKTGFLFVASEFGDHHLYQIANLGDDPEEPEFSSKMHLDEGETFFYGIRELKSLVPIDRIESLCPLTDAYIGDLAREDAPQIYALVGRGARSTLRVLRNGLEVSEMAVSELPGNPNAVWTVKKNIDDKHDAYIVVSFVNATLVLAIGETVEEANDSGFMATTPTLGCGIIGDDALLQIYPEGIRHIRSDRRVNEWKTPGKRQIVKCAMNRRQVAVALAGGELVYFELDPTGQLNEFTERTSWPHEVLCMSLSEIPEGELRSRFLTVGIADSTVRVISLDPQDTLSPLSMQALPSPPESLLLLETTSEDGKGQSTIHLNIGLQNGCLLRTTVDNVTGDMMDTRTRYLGTRPVRVFRVRSQNKDAVLCTSSRSWLLYHYQNRFHLTPLSYVTLESASSFSSEQCLEGIVAIAENTLRIMAVEKLGASFNHITYPLKFTPRRMIVHPLATSIMIIETDHAAYTTITLDKKRNDMADDIVRLATDMEEVELAKEIADVLRNNRPDETVYGAAKAATGKWASVVRLLNVKSGEVLSLFELPQDEAAKCIALVQFASHQDTLMVLVGCTIAQKLSQVAKSTRGCIYTFLLTAAGDRFELIHRTDTPYPVNAIHDFRGSALVGMSNHLRLYEFGKKKLLAKCENKVEHLSKQ
ncbi:splicing factor 3B subunit 3 family protein [Necator americanus]|uniref:Splicing factor 3B subunit 3 family protein n=1 Tax=Necator americanus TaxID=51031 RepID=W2TAY9_NECAM|nr:splicing factor 3B subunit 3 family protein [Necator americanus]ETN79205.1 splicing factor 3B subunit 3 family protein [Necator americanus]